jgi:hypothetical protein
MKIAGYCPLGCGETLYTAHGIKIMCSDPACPDPDAAQKILNEPETEHLVTIAGDGYSVKHPLRERIDNALLDCAAGKHAGYYGAGMTPGRYRLHAPFADWEWQRLDSEEDT